MSAYSSFRSIKSTRKVHQCESCGKPIKIGSPAEYWAGNCDGDFYSCHWHVECRAAEVAINDLNDAWGDEYCGIDFYMEEPSNRAWLIESHPIVAERMGAVL